MQNLKNNSNFNLLSINEMRSIWFPQIIFTNTKDENRLAFDEKSVVNIERGITPGVPVSLEYLVPAHIFDGNSNRIVFTRTYDSELYCDFDLVFYPLDEQHCGKTFKVPASSSDFVDLQPVSIQYTGSPNLAQFSVVDYSFSKDTNGEIGFKINECFSITSFLFIFRPLACL